MSAPIRRRVLPPPSGDINEYPRPLLHDDHLVGRSVNDALSHHELSVSDGEVSCKSDDECCEAVDNDDDGKDGFDGDDDNEENSETGRFINNDELIIIMIYYS